jgi:hypothetical protein
MGSKQRFISLLLPLVVVVSFALTLFVSSGVALAYAAPAGQNCEDGSAPAPVTRECAESTRKTAGTPTQTTPQTGGGDATDKTTDTKGVTCAVEQIGWIVCPIMTGAAKISDKAFDVLADNFLRVDPALVSDDNNGTKLAWDVSRNLGNIMFIIAFLVIIVSQVTGRGLNNYGIKKMLPRLIVAAIAVNVSYYICQLAVDLTNIMGYEIQNMMAQIANTIGPSVFGEAKNFDSTEAGSTGTLITLIVVGSLAVGAVVWIMLSTITALVPLMLITVMTIIIILLLRKALIVLLIVISPIAFVLYLLPNTEKYFSKWLSMFGKLLMVFPTVGLLFGAGQLASTIVLVAGSNGNQAEYSAQCDPDNKESKDAFDKNKKENPSNNSICGEKSVVIQCGKNGDDTGFAGTPSKACKEPRTATWTLGLVALGIAVAPLLAVWSVLQGALSAAGAIGGKITSAVSKGVNGSVKGGVTGGKKLGEKYKASTLGQQRLREKKIREGQARAGAVGEISKWRPITRGKALANRGFNEIGRNSSNATLQGYHAQRGRMVDKDLAEQARDKSQQYGALGNWNEMYANGQKDLATAQEHGDQSGIEQALVMMSAARMAAAQNYDQDGARRMNDGVTAARQAMGNIRSSDERRYEQTPVGAAHTEALKENAAYDFEHPTTDAGRKALANRDAQRVAATHARETEIYEGVRRHEELIGLGHAPTTPTDSDIAQELAHRENIRQNGGTPPPLTPPPAP